METNKKALAKKKLSPHQTKVAEVMHVFKEGDNFFFAGVFLLVSMMLFF
jgi:hypothetical protein